MWLHKMQLWLLSEPRSPGEVQGARLVPELAPVLELGLVWVLVLVLALVWYTVGVS